MAKKILSCNGLEQQVGNVPLKAELDAFCSKLYGFNLEELLYDTEAVYRKYRTKRLVLEAWDRLERGEVMMSEDEEWEIEKQNEASE